MSIKFRPLITLSAVLSIALSACNFFSQQTDIQTENLQSELARTQIAGIRQSATLEAGRLAITADFAQESVQNAQLQSTRIASTLIASGMGFVEAPQVSAVAANQGQPTPEAPPGDVLPVVTESVSFPEIANPIITQGASARGDATIIAPSITPVIQSQSGTGDTGGTLSNIRTSARVGGDDCPISPTNSFSEGISEIYVSAVANDVRAGTLISSRWVHDGTEAAYYEWTPDFDIDGACIWFNAPSNAVALTAGNWTVQLAVDGTPVGDPISFTIVSG